MDQGRAEIVATNEAQVRAFNERLLVSTDGGPLEILCECGIASCHVPLTIDAGEYRDVRADPCRFFVAPGHEIPDIETVVGRGGDHLVVEKPPEVGHVVTSDGAPASGDGQAEHLEEKLTYVWTSSDEVEFAEAGDVGRRLPVVHDLVMPLAGQQGRRVRVTVRDGVVVEWSPGA